MHYVYVRPYMACMDGVTSRRGYTRKIGGADAKVGD